MNSTLWNWRFQDDTISALSRVEFTSLNTGPIRSIQSCNRPRNYETLINRHSNNARRASIGPAKHHSAPQSKHRASYSTAPQNQLLVRDAEKKKERKRGAAARGRRLRASSTVLECGPPRDNEPLLLVLLEYAIAARPGSPNYGPGVFRGANWTASRAIRVHSRVLCRAAALARELMVYSLPPGSAMMTLAGWWSSEGRGSLRARLLKKYAGIRGGFGVASNFGRDGGGVCSGAVGCRCTVMFVLWDSAVCVWGSTWLL